MSLLCSSPQVAACVSLRAETFTNLPPSPTLLCLAPSAPAPVASLPILEHSRHAPALELSALFSGELHGLSSRHFKVFTPISFFAVRSSLTTVFKMLSSPLSQPPHQPFLLYFLPSTYHDLIYLIF